MILLLLLTTGCASYSARQVPDEVAMIPNDCANEKAITTWLEENANLPKGRMTSDEDYKRTQSYYKHRLWNLRYICNSL
ncbi:MAG: hypothetical protein EB168_03360 [Euryarchaeota archaeon]|nr:hypothetical protein [Euryarchaeota archaeon]